MSMENRNPMRILICSENVPPQVNGIARRIGHYAEGLRKLGCMVDLLHPDCGADKTVPFLNPWNFTARMMVLLPHHFIRLLSMPYDVVHVVLPLNLSGMWLLAGFKVARCFSRQAKPALVISWHCNLWDYVEFHSTPLFKPFLRFVIFDLLFGILPSISDRILSPTKSSDPKVIQMWSTGKKDRSGVCYTGIQKGAFSPENKNTPEGKIWEQRKIEYLAETKSESLILCVSRLSLEKEIHELIKGVAAMKGCCLWLIGDGPARPELEDLAKALNAPVKFWGYQKGDALHSVYTVADVFALPSLTETFGQTVNEALASQCRVALPSVPVFLEAYSDILPEDAFWQPLNRQSMIQSLQAQLERHKAGNPVGVPDLSKLKSWDEACESLLEEYKKAENDKLRFMKRTIVLLPFWWMTVIFSSIAILIFAKLRQAVGGSIRYFLRNIANQIKVEIKTIRNKVRP
jgi:glycosyltransferase involved in cell wall biosynthesis